MGNINVYLYSDIQCIIYIYSIYMAQDILNHVVLLD